MSKKYKNKTCVYCGVPNASTTADHVFAREFFLPNQRQDLPQVPACAQCNLIKSEYEHYLTAVLPFAARHCHAEENLSTMVPKRLYKNTKLQRKLKESWSQHWVTSDSGVVEPRFGMSIDCEKLLALAQLIVRAFVHVHFDVQLLSNDVVDVGMKTAAFERLFELDESKVLESYRVQKDYGSNVFQYRGWVDKTNQSTYWLIGIYGGIRLAGDPRFPLIQATCIGARTFARCDDAK